MLQIIILASTISLALGQYGHGGYGGHGGYEEHYAPQPYKFGYDVKDGYGGQLHQQETGDSYNNKKGSYGYTDPYGIYRQVDYVADKYGFRATVKTNEPGTANQGLSCLIRYKFTNFPQPDPADVRMYANPVQTHYQPAPYKSASYHAPSYGHGGYGHNDHGYGQTYVELRPSKHYGDDHYGNDHGYGGHGYGGHGYGRSSYKTKVYHAPKYTAPKYSPPKITYGYGKGY